MSKFVILWEGNVTTRRNIQTEHIHFVGFWDIREGVTLRRLEYGRQFFVHQFYMSCSLLMLNCPCSFTSPNCNLKVVAIPCIKIWALKIYNATKTDT